MTFRYEPKTEKLIVTKATRIEYHQLSIWLTRKVNGFRFMQSFKMGIWDGNKSFFDNGKINLGLWKECYNACKEIGVAFNLENKEDFPLNREVTLEKVRKFCKEFFKDHKIKDKKTGEWKPFFPYDYQIESAFKALKNRYCLLEVATSGGKTLIISIVIFYILKNINPDAKFLVITPAINLVSQFYDEIMTFNYGEQNLEKLDTEEKNRELFPNSCNILLEEIMSDKPRKTIGNKNPNIHIGCFQSLEKWPKEFFEKFYMVAADESHGSTSKSMSDILKRTFCHAEYRFGVSGTFPDPMSCEILSIQSVLGPIVTQIEAHTLIKEGTITPLKVKAVFLNHQDPDFEEKLKAIKRMGVGNKAFELEKKYVHESEPRLEFIKKLVNKFTHNGLILFHTIEYGQKILEKLSKECPDKIFHYIDGSVKNKERDFIKNEMEKDDGKIRITIASYGTMSQGVSIKNIFYLTLTDSFKSDRMITQSIGRAIRLLEGKNEAIIFDIVDVFNDKFSKNTLYNHFKEREKHYKKRKYPYQVLKFNL